MFCIHSGIYLQFIDGGSAFLSFAGFCVSLFFMLTAKNPIGVSTYREQMIFTTDYDFVSSADALREQTLQLCSAAVKKKDAYEMYYSDQTWGTVYRGVPLGLETFIIFYPWLMLQWVMLCSMVFQGARCVGLKVVEQNAVDDSGSMRKNSDVSAIEKSHYSNSCILVTYIPQGGPDFWRWMEYAITSPLQIILVASSFFMREINFLLLIACVQGALVVLGYSIELQIEKICDKKIANGRHERPQCTFIFLDFFKLYFTFASACFFHAVIWGILITKFVAQADALIDCQNSSTMPGSILGIIIGQCAAFSLFGLVVMFQIIYISCVDIHRNMQAENMWWTVSVCYSILSVVSKMLLEYGFLSLYVVNQIM